MPLSDSKYTRCVRSVQKPLKQAYTPVAVYVYCRKCTEYGYHAPGGIRPHKISGRSAADLRLRPPGHWDRTFRKVTRLIFHHILRDDLN